MTARDHQGIVLSPLAGVQWDAGKIKSVQHVGVAELCREAQSEHIERSHRPVGVQGELGQPVASHQYFQVAPHRVRALGQNPVLLVQDLVEDRDALVGQPDLVCVGVAQAPPHLDGIPILHLGVQFAADVLDRLADPGQQRLQAGKDRVRRLRADKGHDEVSLNALPW